MFKSILKLSFLLLFVISTECFAQQNFPIGVQHLMFAEQSLISREVDLKRIKSPKLNEQDQKFAPESKNVFSVKSYWVDQKDVHSFFADQAGSEVHSLFERNYQGKRQFRLLVHPESESLYQNFLQERNAVPAESFLAMATSSSRTLLVWPENKPELCFFGKLSLNKSIGGVVRTIPISETTRSVGMTNVLRKETHALPKSFDYLPENFSLIPKGFDRGGMIIRSIPEKLKGQKYIPLFSLYGGSSETTPVLAQMINQSNLPADIFVRKYIIKPFIKQWIELHRNLGITMEPHAQNVLIGIGQDGLPNGQFMHRDFGGFSMDLKYRDAIKRPKATLTYVKSIEKEYHQVSEDKSYDLTMPRSLDVYFGAGFLYNLDTEISKWNKAGLISDYAGQKNEKLFRDMMYEELFTQSKDFGVNISTWKKFFMDNSSKTISKIAFDIRDKYAEEPQFQIRSCSMLFAH